MRRLYWAGIALLMATVFISSGQNNSTEIVCSNPEDCYNQGMELLSQGNCSEAYDTLQRVIADNPENSDAWVGKGRAAACMDNFSEAIRCCEVAMVWDSENAQAYVVKAEVLLAQNRTDQARAMMEDAVKKNISNPVLWIECGKVFSRMEMWEDAQKCFNRATDIDINNAEGLYLEAKALQRLGRFEEAILVYNQSVIINTTNTNAWLGRSQTLEALRLYAEAEKSYSKVLDLDPTNEEALFQKGMMLLMLKRNEEAVETLTNLTELAPNDATAWMRTGLALAKLGKCNESLAAYDKAIALEANNTEAWIGRGDAQLCLGWINQAQETYEAVLRNDRLNGPAQERLARIYYLNGDYGVALTLVRKSIGRESIPPADYAQAWLTYANALNASHEHDSAIEQYQIAIEKVPFISPLDAEIDLKDVEWAMESVYLHRADHEYHNQLALNRSDYSHAREYFQTLTEKNKSDTIAWMMLGICSLKLWQFDKAEACFNQVLEPDPTDRAALDWVARVNDERQPHIILVDFSNEGIDFGSINIFDLRGLISWRPPENFRAELENLADVDGITQATIWTVQSDNVNRVRLATFEIPVEKNSQNTLNKQVSIPWDAFINPPTTLYELYKFYQDIKKVELTCEVAVKETS